MKKASVSEIHLCLRCPRLFAYNLRGASDAWKVGLRGDGSLPGKLFHDQIAAPFHLKMSRGKDSFLQNDFKKLFTEKGKKLDLGLLSILENHFFLPVVKKCGNTLNSTQIIQLGKGLELWCRILSTYLSQMVSNRKYSAALMKKIFHDPEKTVSSVFTFPSGARLNVSGKYDAAFFDVVANEAVVIEFKGQKAGRVDEDYSQVLLYAWLIRQNTGVTPRGVVLYLEEEDAAVEYSASDLTHGMSNLESLFQDVLAVIEGGSDQFFGRIKPASDPGLCNHCPFDPQCDYHWGPREDWNSKNLLKPYVEPNSGLEKTDFTGEQTAKIDNKSSHESEENAQTLLEMLVQTLAALKLPVKANGYIIGPRFIRFKIKPIIRKGATAKKIMNQAENLQVELGLGGAPLIQPQAGYVSVDAPRQHSVPLTLEEVWRKGAHNRPKSKAAFPLGAAIDGSVVWADLSDPSMTSILVGGTSGSGKSVMLRSSAVGLAMNASPENLKILLIDPKRVSFTDLTGLPHLLGEVLTDAEPALEALEQIVGDMEYRYRLFADSGVQDIDEYNKISNPLHHLVVIIDEYADFVIDKGMKPLLETFIQRLGQKGRAAGFHLIVATQRPDAKVVTPIIKANLQLKAALKVTSASNSAIILDQNGAEYLIGSGDMLLGGSIPIQRVQGPLLTRTEISRVCKTRD